MNMMEPNAENFKLINQAIANIDKKYGKILMKDFKM